MILLVMTFQCTWWDSRSSSSSSDQRAPLPPLVIVVVLLLHIIMCACKRFSSSSHCCCSHHEEESFLANPKPFLLIRLNGSIFLTNESRRNMGFIFLIRRKKTQQNLSKSKHLFQTYVLVDHSLFIDSLPNPTKKQKRKQKATVLLLLLLAPKYLRTAAHLFCSCLQPIIPISLG